MPVAFQQKIKFNNIPEEEIANFNFDGGMVTDKHETKLEPSQSPDMANVIFNETGSIKTRNGYLRYNTTPVGASSDTSNAGAATGDSDIVAYTDYVAQTFQPSGAINVAQIDMYLAMATASQEQLVRVELWSTDSGAPDALLTNGQSQIKLISGTSETTYNFRFRTPVALSASTTYAIVVKAITKGSTTTIRTVEVSYTGNDYANGSVYTSDDAGITWSADSTKDLRFNVYAGGDTGCTGLIRYYGANSLTQTFAKFGTSLYRGNDAGGTMTAITLGSGASLASAAYLDYTIVNNTLLVVDGTNEIQKYNGSTNANYSTGTISVTNGDATITGSGTSWNTSTNAEAGEYIQLPDDKWYKIISIASDTSLEVEVNYQGSNTSGEAYVISPWGEVQGDINSSTAISGLTKPTGGAIENHLNRVWNLDGNSLKYSALDTSINGEHFNDWDTSNNAGEILIPGQEGGSGTALYSFNGVLYIFQRRAIWGLYGTSPGNFELKNISNEIGVIDKRTIAEWNDVLIFLSDNGIILFDGTNIRNISEGIVNTSIDAWASMTSPAATFWKNKYLISYTPSGGTYNTEMLFFDLVRGVYGKVEGAYASIFSQWKGASDSGQIYFGSANQGTVYLWDTGGHDDGYMIETRYDTGSLGFDRGMNDKTIKKYFVQQIGLGDWSMSVYQYTDITNDETTSSISLNSGDTALWDVAQWDVDEWSSEASLITTRIADFQGIGKYYKYRFYQLGYEEGLEILGMLVTARLRRLV